MLHVKFIFKLIQTYAHFLDNQTEFSCCKQDSTLVHILLVHDAHDRVQILDDFDFWIVFRLV